MSEYILKFRALFCDLFPRIVRFYESRCEFSKLLGDPETLEVGLPFSSTQTGYRARHSPRRVTELGGAHVAGCRAAEFAGLAEILEVYFNQPNR